MTLTTLHRLRRGYFTRPLSFWLKSFAELIALIFIFAFAILVTEMAGSTMQPQNDNQEHGFSRP